MTTRITGSRCIAERFTPKLRDLEHEECWLLTLTKDNDVIGEHLIAEGTPTGVRILARRVLRAVLIDDAEAFAIVHNHPSNEPEPSQADVDATMRLIRAARIVGLRMLDHVICTPSGEHYSFDMAGHLKKESNDPAELVLRSV